MIHVIRVCGHADWIDRMTASAWQQSPIADKRMMQIESGGWADIVLRVSVQIILARQMTESDHSIIVYDDAVIGHIDASLFDAMRWPAAAYADGPGGGRGRALFIEFEGQQWVLRHYCRGGLVRWLSDDRFVWTGLDRSRPLREWALLEEMYRSALPVPRPVAGRVERRGAVYTADLITVCIPDVTTLSQRLSCESLSTEIWRSVGLLIARFHAAGICHADLNAHNIQIDANDRLYLLDFDRSRIRIGSDKWKQRNLDRLHRSLSKLLARGVIRFSDSDWNDLIDGYRMASPEIP